MFKLSFIVFIAFINLSIAQSPHGVNFKIACANCHTTADWNVDLQKIKFEHEKTNFPLIGQHEIVDCKSCHLKLVFDNTPDQCSDCHKDIHESTVGIECARCHETTSWLVNKITEIHQMSRFPLLGEHLTADCNECHSSASNVKFEPLDVDCKSCHINDYNSARNPNHITAGFSTECLDCHNLNAVEWSMSEFAHDFFPLVDAHEIANCFQCHQQNSFIGLSGDCISCHQSSYNSTTNPNHALLSFSNDCSHCHTLTPGWSPAEFKEHDNIYPLIGAHSTINNCSSCHINGYSNTPNQCIGCHESDFNGTADPSHTALNFSSDCETCHSLSGWKPATFDHDGQYFPIYSGSHAGQWDKCSDCHTDANNYGNFSCVTCHDHNQIDMDNEHREISGYVYESNQCFACHPSGSSEGSFNHATSAFPLVGMHTQIGCEDCHASGYSNTNSDCYSCHQNEFQSTVNPSHLNLALDTNCDLCHSMEPGWKPAQFPVHNTYYELLGAHASISNECETCHNNDYNNTPNMCVDCHQQNYDLTSDPPHLQNGFNTDCEVCHTQDAWMPANYEHDGQYFPIYTGSHSGEWNVCSDCHTVQSNYNVFECINCHEHNQADTDVKHIGISGYIYSSSECYACHPTGEGEGFNHALSNFPLTGSHITTDCKDCHATGYAGTSSECFVCHQTNYQNSTNPNHQNLSIDTGCETCHNTGPGWSPAEFPVHNNYYELLGAHAGISNDCATCHNNDYNNTPNQCAGCHQIDYDQTTDPNHTTSGFSNECESCHSQSAWTPATFDHALSNFPLTGEHINAECKDCHASGYSGTSTQCFSCHQDKYDQTTDPNHLTSGFTNDCESCHNTTAWVPSTFDHALSNFPLTGAHISVECQDCHTAGYQGTSTACFTCHETNYQNSANPSHQNLALDTNCETCHTTGPGWSPAEFPVHNNYYELLGAHSSISNDCSTCHNGDYNNTPNQCVGCHQNNYDQTTDPNHSASGFSTDCQACHTQTAWKPATFDHATTNFPLTGAHINVQCGSCHTNGYQGTSTICYDCHKNDYDRTTDPNHSASGFSTDCESCHTTNGWTPSTFDHDGQYFPIYSGKHRGEWNTCSDCHNVQSNYKIFECINCHEHSKSSTDSEHSDVNNYVYLSTACYDCHPDGRNND